MDATQKIILNTNKIKEYKKMIRRRIIFFALFFFAFGMLFAQQTKKDSILSFTLKSAQDYALQNSPVIKNANLDLESAKKKIFETTAIGLPQVNSKFAYSYQISIPDMEKQFSGLTQLGGWMYGVDSYLAATSGNHNFGHIAAPDPNQKTITDIIEIPMATIPLSAYDL